MKREWVCGSVSDAWCADVLTRALSLPAKPATVGQNGANASRLARRSVLRWLPRDSFADVYDVVWAHGRSANLDFAFDVDDIPYVQLAEYNETDLGFFARHQDVFWVSEATPASQRKITVVIELSDPASYVGGSLTLMDVSKAPPMLRPRGTVLSFPAWLYHGVTPVTAGTRYTLTAWLNGPPWK